MNLAKYRTISPTFELLNQNSLAMKTLKILLLSLVIIIGGACIWLATLPDHYEVRREATINAPAEVVFSMINEFKEWESWSPWGRRDSSLALTYGEITSGVGAQYSWVGDAELSGAGGMTITKSEPNQLIEFEIKMVSPYESVSNGYFKLEEVDGMTKVSWGDMGKLPFFLRFMNIDDMLGPVFEDGLQYLKEVCEAKATMAPEIPVEIVETEEISYYYISADSVSVKDMGTLIGNSYGEIMAYLAEDANNYTGHPFTISRKWDNELMMGDIDICLPINSTKPGNERVKKATKESGRAVRAMHYGKYELVGPAYFAAEEFIEKNGLKYNDFPREIYVTDPGQEPDTAKWLTYVEYPIE